MVDYENPWMYKGRPFTTEKIKDYYGFLYLIENKLTGRKYIGRKYFVQKRKPKGGKRRVTSESDWKKYYGSNEQLKSDAKDFGKENFSRKILSLHKTVGKTNYAETEALFKYNVLREKMDNGSPMYYNDNILGRYFKKHYWED